MRAVALLMLLPIVAACGREETTPTVRLQVDAAPAITRPIETDDAGLLVLSEQVEQKIDAIRAILERNSLTRLARLADSEPSFVSNFAGESNRVHWDLLRRTGFDPLAQLERLLDGQYGVREVGDEVWYIWPDLAALEPQELVPERLSFTDRAKLLELVGDEGIERIRDGQGYPGVRTAIAEDGRWLYFIHESEDMATAEDQNE
ncbi:MAG: hypothetical protein AAFZ91_15380 [Pseudomonadota bacterium]